MGDEDQEEIPASSKTASQAPEGVINQLDESDHAQEELMDLEGLRSTAGPRERGVGLGLGQEEHENRHAGEPRTRRLSPQRARGT